MAAVGEFQSVGVFLKRGRPAAVTGGGAVGGYASTGTRPLSRDERVGGRGFPDRAVLPSPP